MNRRFAASVLVTTILAACAVGPDYARPKQDLPPLFTQAADAKLEVPLSVSWWKAFGDPVLDRMVEEAMAANDDIYLAAARVAEARANLDLAEANRLPQVSYNGSVTRRKNSRESFGNLGSTGTNGTGTGIGAGVGGVGGTTGTGSSTGGAAAFLPGIINNYTLSGLLSFDLDLWGRLRRADEAATAALLSTEAARDNVRLTVITDVVGNYVNLLAIDRQIAVTQDTIKSREEGLVVFEKRFKAEVISALDLRQAQSELATAREQLPVLIQQKTEAENALTILLGKSPREITENVPTRGKILEAMPVPPQVPNLLPSNLLERRPDIRSAEQQLVSANAEIGFAKAAYFPQLTLNGLFGFSSLQLDRLFKSTAEQWSIGGSVAGPLLDFGRTTANVDAAKARTDQALASYRQTVRNAFAEVVNSFAAQATSEERLAAAKDRAAVLREYLRLAQLRYDAGYSDYLDVLDAQRNYFASQLNLVTAERDRLVSIVTLYKALGGGWDPNPPAVAAIADEGQAAQAEPPVDAATKEQERQP